MIKKGLLKSFFILGLTLLPISFSSAFNYKTGNTTTSWRINSINDSFSFSPYDNDYMFMVEKLGGLKTVYGLTKKNMLYLSSNFIFFWDNGNPYFYLSNNRQGVPAKFVLCDSFGISETPQNCSRSEISDYTKSFSKSFFKSLSSSDRYFVSYEQQRGVPGYPSCSSSIEESYTVCFSSSSKSQSICFYVANYTPGVSCNVSVGLSEGREVTTLQGSLGLDNPTYSSINSSLLGDTPGVFTVPDYEFNEDDIYTNKQIIQGYNAMGLTDEFCYGGFALDNIFEAGTVPQMFTGYRWGGGAFIFDIWDIYSGAYNNDYISFLRSFYISYENNNYSDFYGKTKALYGFVNQWFSVSSKGLGFIEATAPTFTLVDVWQYCDLKFNKDSNAVYTGDRWDPKFRYYTSGQVDLGGYFNFSGNNNYFSGNLSGFNTPKDFFASLNSIFQGGLNNLDNREPVLPTYIIVFFLAIIFIRIISH